MRPRTDDDESAAPSKPARAKSRPVCDDSIVQKDDTHHPNTAMADSQNFQSREIKNIAPRCNSPSTINEIEAAGGYKRDNTAAARSSPKKSSEMHVGAHASSTPLSDKESLSIAQGGPSVTRRKDSPGSIASTTVALSLADSDATNETAKANSKVSAAKRRLRPGAHQVGGIRNDDHSQPPLLISSQSQVPSLAPVVASVVQPEADVESQTRNIEKRVREEMINSVVAAEVVDLSEGKSESEPPNRRRLWIILSLIALLVIGGIVGAIVILTGGNTPDNGDEPNQSTQLPGKTSPPRPTAAPATANPTSKPTVFIPACTLCFDGTEPTDLTPEVRRGVTCADLQINLAELETADDQVCKSGQATAWLFCSCPTLPPRPLSSVCSAECPIDSRPPAFDSEVCRNFETFVEIVGQQEDECAGLIELTPSACVCSPRITDMRDILKSVSDEQDLLDISTPQYMALEWLANKDPANLTISEMSGTALQNRYFGALLWFGFGGENWDEQYSFKSESDVCDWNDGDFGIFCDDPAGTPLITKVKMNNNTLVGRFPDEFTKFTNLVSIALYTNFISGTFPAGIGDLTELQYFDLDGNEKFGGRLPSSLFELRKLSVIWLDDCSLVGSLPENIGNAVALTSLSIINSGLNGTIPASLSELSLLQFLYLSKAELSGNLPNLEKMPGMSWLDLSENSFSGTIPDHYGQFPLLTRLFLDQNFLTGSIPDLSDNHRLWYLYLYDNILTGSVERLLTTTLTSFTRYMSLDQNQLTGSIPATVANFQELNGLWLYDNKLTGTIPTEVGLLTSLSFGLEVNINMLNGTIPTELAQLVTSEFLHMAGNQLTGPIPTELGFLTAISYLNIGENELTGTVPSSLGLMTALTVLAISENQLVGTLPTELGFLTNLRVLDLNTNLLNGTIPTELAGIRSMERVSFAINNFSGTVPTEMASIPNLELFWIQTNDITGDLGPYFCERANTIEVFVADCFVDNREVSCDCCSTCCDSSSDNCYEQ